MRAVLRLGAGGAPLAALAPVLALLALPAGDCRARSALDVPLTVRDEAGVSWAARPASSGIPLPGGEIFSPDNLKVTDSSGETVPCQFRILSRWGDGSIRVVLAEFLADVQAGGTASYSLKYKEANEPIPGTALTVDEGNPEYIEVATGEITVRIRKSGFTLFDRVVMNGVELVSPSTENGLVVTGLALDQYRSGLFDNGGAADGVSIEATVEESGPVRACLLVRGWHEARDGARKLEYTVRMHFYAGKSSVRVMHTLRNARQEVYEHVGVKDISAVTRLNAPGPLEYAIGGEGEVHSGSIGETGRAYVFQDGNDIGLVGGKLVGTVPYLGYRVFAKANADDPGDLVERTGNRAAAGWMDVYSPGVGHGLAVAVKHFSQDFPKGLEVTGDGAVHARLVPRYWTENNQNTYHLYHNFYDDVPIDAFYVPFQSYEVSELLYYFHAGDAADAAVEEEVKRFRRRLAPTADPAWYAQSKAFGDFATRAEEEALFTSWGWTVLPMPDPGGTPNALQRRAYPYYYSQDSEEEELYDMVHQYMKSLDRRYLDYAEGVSRCYAYSTRQSDGDGFDAPFPGILPLNRYKLLYFDFMGGDHRYGPGLGLYYLLTGEREALENYEGYAEGLLHSAMNSPLHANGYHYWWIDDCRDAGRVLWALAELMGVTPDQTLRGRIEDALSLNVSLLKETIDGVNAPGGSFDTIDRDRGWVYSGDLEYAKPFMLGIFMNGWSSLYRSFSRDEDLRDYIIAMEDWIAEMWQDEADFPDVGYPYRWYYFDTNNGGIDPGHEANYNSNGIMQAYEMTGRGAFLDVATTGFQAYMTKEGDQRRFRIAGYRWRWLTYRLAHPKVDTTPPGAIQDLLVTDRGGGSWLLEWTAPPDDAGAAGEYEVKYDELPIVEKIAYPEDIGLKRNFWASRNVDYEPTPAPAGTSQQLTVTGLDPSKEYYFAIKSYDAENNQSAISRQSGVSPTPTYTPALTPTGTATPPPTATSTPSAARTPTATGTPTITATPPSPLPARVNFQPSAAATPVGYLIDDGSRYGARGPYGWR